MTNNKTINVIKRNGKKEPLDLNKFHRVVINACDGITGVSASEIELASQIQFYDGITSQEIQETLIKAASNLISEETPNYQHVAGRLVSYDLRKRVYGQYEPTHILTHVKKLVNMGLYEPKLLEWYDEEEWNKIQSFINHTRDDEIAYVGIEQFREKYLVRDRSTGTIYETPQIAYALIAATLFHNYPRKTRLQWVKDLYDATSTFTITLPTPIMAGVRTTKRQFSSCVLVDAADNLDSINAAASAIVKYVSNRAGIGLNVGRIRALGSKIGEGHATHTGMLPFIKYFQAAVKSCSQGGVRGGAATFYFPLWHLEAEQLLVLKNNKGTEETRARHVDYGVQLNKVMYERLLEGKSITLFSPHDVPEVYEAFFAKDVDNFRYLYEQAENNPNIRKKVVPAIDLFSSLIQERKDTGRIYIMNVDNVNAQGMFEDSVYMSNLCVSGDTIVTIQFPNGQIEDVAVEVLINNILPNHNKLSIYGVNHSNNENGFYPIEDYGMTSPKSKVMKITDEETGKFVVVTPEHRIFTKNRGYVMAKDLKHDDLLWIM